MLMTHATKYLPCIAPPNTKTEKGESKGSSMQGLCRGSPKQILSSLSTPTSSPTLREVSSAHFETLVTGPSKLNSVLSLGPKMSCAVRTSETKILTRFQRIDWNDCVAMGHASALFAVSLSQKQSQTLRTVASLGKSNQRLQQK